MATVRDPLVSVGVPVYNGESGLAASLDSLLRQDYSNLEIIVSDNASTDATSEIGALYARMDPRIKYFRSETNRGPIWNFNRVFELSSGTYFMWAAHDDLREPAFVRACVERLEANPDAVLCQARTAVSIEGIDGTLYIANLDSFAGSRGVVARYRETLRHLPATAIYGIYRSAAMRKTRLWQPAISTDLAFMQEMAIHGRFMQADEILFRYRGRPSWNTIHQEVRFFLGVDRKPLWYVPFVALLMDHAARVWHAPIRTPLKARLWGVLLAHSLEQIAIKTAVKVAGLVCPNEWKEPVGETLYRRWMQNPNIIVLLPDLFLQRVSKPQLGWWR